MSLGQKAKGICKENYKTNCPRCPIRQECIRSIGPGHEGLANWQQRVNAAAEQIQA